MYKCLSRYGDFLVGMVLATVLALYGLLQYFELRYAMQARIEEKFALEQLAIVGKTLHNYITSNRRRFFSNPLFTRASASEKAVFALNDAAFQAFCTNEINQYAPLGGNRDIAGLRNIWGDRYKLIVVRRENTAKTGTSHSTETGTVTLDTSDTDLVTMYVIATGGTKKRHAAGTADGEKWIQTGMRRIVMEGGPSFAFVRNNASGVRELTNLALAETDGIATSGAQVGDIGYIASINTDDAVTDRDLLRQRTGSSYADGETFDDKPNTMFASLDMNDRNLLNIRNVTAGSIDAANVRFDSTLYATEQEAESSCRENWMYIRDREGKGVPSDGDGYVRLRVDANGRVTRNGTVVGTYGMNGRIQRVNNEGRLYYISPSQLTKANGASTTRNRNNLGTLGYLGEVKPRLAICRKIDGRQTLAYLGDSRAEDKVAFILTAVDGDYIPPFYCPGQDTNVAGGGSMESFSGASRLTGTTSAGNPQWSTTSPATNDIFATNITPRLFIVPQVVTSGPDAYPLQGIRAFAEVRPEGGWVVRLNALVDKNRGTLYDSVHGYVNERSYWVGNYHTGSDATDFTSDSTEFKTLRALNRETSGEKFSTDGAYLGYLRAVVIGVCSGKNQTF